MWRNAWQSAINVVRPDRRRLYDIYDDIITDLHLSGAIDQRKDMVLQKTFVLTDKSTGEQSDKGIAVFEAAWFKDLMSLALDSIYYGHSLIQLGNIVDTDDCKAFSCVELVPRKHVSPEFGTILRSEGDDPRSGISYRDGILRDWCIEVGKPRDLGKLLKCVPSAISKRNALAYWDEFGQLFGIPVRIAKTSSRDSQEINSIKDMLQNMGPAAWGLFPEGTELEFVENGKGDAFNVFDKRIDRANSEMSKGILGQTMTLDSGSSLSQSEVHLEVLKNLVEKDADMVRDIINDKLLPLMNAKGFGLEGMRFDWVNDTQYSPEQQLQMEQMLLTAGYEIDPDYFQQKYGVPIVGFKNVFVFSGFKTHAELKEVSSKLLNPDGSIKSWNDFRKEILAINKEYNENYLRAEYNHAVASAQMAAKWQEFERDKDSILLEYRTAKDGKVRPEHRKLDGVTLPVDDPFWKKYCPPLDWNCRCTVVAIPKIGSDEQVPALPSPENPLISDSARAISIGEAATAKPKQQIFRNNPGQDLEIFPRKHPYLPKGCGECRQGKSIGLAGYVEGSEKCRVCSFVKVCFEKYEYEQEKPHRRQPFEENGKIYGRNWERVYKCEETGGYIAVEDGHGNKEKEQNINSALPLAKDGHKIELLKTIKGSKSRDANVDDEPWEFKKTDKYINLKNSIKDKVAQGLMQGAKVVLVDIVKNEYYSEQSIIDGVDDAFHYNSECAGICIMLESGKYFIIRRKTWQEGTSSIDIKKWLT